MNEHFCSIVTNNVPIDIVLKSYRNRDLLIITQVRKIGPILLINRESSPHDYNSDNNIFTIKTIFGNSSVQIQAAARYIAEQININKPIVISLTLKDYNVETLKPIVAALNRFKTAESV